MEQFRNYEQISNIWLQYRHAIGKYICKIVKDQDTANHLSHEVLLKLYSSCHSGRPVRNVRSWLFQIAYNTCMDHLKSDHQLVQLEEEIPLEEHGLGYKKASEFIEALLDRLPEKYRYPLLLSDLREMKQHSIAQKLGLSLTATKSRIQRGRRMLKKEILDSFHVELDSSGDLAEFSPRTSRPSLKKKTTCSTDRSS